MNIIRASKESSETGGPQKQLRRVLETVERALEPAGKASEPVGRASETNEWATEPAERALESAGRPRGGGPRKKNNYGAFLVCGGTIGHHSVWQGNR